MVICKLWITAILAAALTMLQGCSIKVDGLVVRKDFTQPAITEGGVLVGGVVGTPGQFDLQQSNDLSNVMTLALKRERRYLRLGPPSLLFNRVGEERYVEIMNAFAKADLDEKVLAGLAPAVDGNRYLALAKVNSDTTKQSTSEKPASERKDKEGKIVRSPAKICRTHQRTVAATMTVYDLQTGSVAFSGYYRWGRSRAAEYDRYEEQPPKNLLVAILFPPKHVSNPYPMPDPPTTGEVLEGIFEVFGDNFPDQRSGTEKAADKLKAFFLGPE